MYGVPSSRSASARSPRAIAVRIRVLETRSPSSIALGTPIPSRPCAARCDRANATSPTRFAPKRKFAPTTMTRAPSPPTTTSSKNAAGDSDANARSNVSTNISSTPARANALTRSASVAICGGTSLGRKHASGCSPNVSTAVRSPARRACSITRTSRLMPQVKPVEDADRNAQRMPYALGAICLARRQPVMQLHMNTLRGASSAPTVSPTPTSTRAESRTKTCLSAERFVQRHEPAGTKIGRPAPVEHHGRNRDHAFGRNQRRQRIRGDLVQRQALVEHERPRRFAQQRSHVPDRPARRRQILAQRPHVRSLATRDAHAGRCRRCGPARSVRRSSPRASRRSTVSPRRASSCSRCPSWCTALNIGGTCSIAPTNEVTAAASRRSMSSGTGAVAITLPTPSAVSVARPSTSVNAYALRRSSISGNKRVARPSATGNTPAACGSSVPRCPDRELRAVIGRVHAPQARAELGRRRPRRLEEIQKPEHSAPPSEAPRDLEL